MRAYYLLDPMISTFMNYLFSIPQSPCERGGHLISDSVGTGAQVCLTTKRSCAVQPHANSPAKHLHALEWGNGGRLRELWVHILLSTPDRLWDQTQESNKSWLWILALFIATPVIWTSYLTFLTLVPSPARWEWNISHTVVVEINSENAFKAVGTVPGADCILNKR